MEPKADMLPDASLTSQVVIEDKKIEKPVEPVVDAQAQPEVSKGDQTPPNKLYAALQEERKRVKELELELEASKNVPSDEDLSDEGRELRKQIKSLEDKVELGGLYRKYSVLEEKATEFDEFRAEYPRHKLENVAKLFLVEKGLLEPAPNRPGLERPTAGPKTGPSKKYTGEDISAMMKNDNRRFQRLVREGKIRAEDIESVA